jgi:putative transposase
VINAHRSLLYYRSGKDDSALITKLSALAELFPTRGFDKYYSLIRKEGIKWARSGVLRVYREMKLCRRRKHKRRLPARIKQPLEKQTEVNYSYSMDFMSGSLVSGRKLRILKVVDDCTRESLAVWCDYAILGEKVVDILEDIIGERGKPCQIRVDNGPEFTGTVFTSWCKKQSITIRYIQTSRPMQNAYIERLNRTCREDVLDAYLFESLEQVRIQSDEWQYKYNYLLPHESLDDRTPAMIRESLSATHHSQQTIEHDQQILTQHQNKQLSILNDATTTKKSKLALS